MWRVPAGEDQLADGGAEAGLPLGGVLDLAVGVVVDQPRLRGVAAAGHGLGGTHLKAVSLYRAKISCREGKHKL